MASSSRSVLCSVCRSIWHNSNGIRPPPNRRSIYSPSQIRSRHSMLIETESFAGNDPNNEKGNSSTIFRQISPTSTVQEEIEYLDSLNPENQFKERKRNNTRIDYVRDSEEWTNTLMAVKKSFSVNQLKRMIHQIETPNTLLQQIRRSKKESRMTKDVYATALIIDRFGLEDPSKKEKEVAEKELAESIENYQFTLPLHVAHLVFDIETSESGELFRRLGVSVSASPKTESDKESSIDAASITVDLKGTKSKVEEVIDWLNDFSKNVYIEKCPISDLISSNWKDVSDVIELDKIAQKSKSIITLGESPEYEITIYSVNKSSSDKAKSLLTRYQYDLRRMKDRAMFSYTSPSVSQHAEDSLPMYAMDPFTGLSSSTDPLDSNLFRLTRQDRDSHSEQARIMPLGSAEPIGTDAEDGKLLERIDRPEVRSKDIFKEMEDHLTTSQPDNESMISFRVDFGHLLFKGDDVSHQELIPEPPLPDQWILERAADWLTKDIQAAREKDVLPLHPPTFHFNVPPSAAKIQSLEEKQNLVSSFNFFKDEDETPSFGNRPEVEHGKDQADGVSDILRSFNPSLISRKEYKLDDLVKKMEKFDECFVIRYVSEGEIIEIKLEAEFPEESAPTSFMDDLFGPEESTEETTQEKAKWNILSIEQIRSSFADVLVPEAPTDVRLSANERTVLNLEEIFSSNEEWQTFLTNIKPTRNDKMFMFENVDKFSAPSRIELKGKQFSLLEQVSVNQWKWDLDTIREKVQPYKAKAIYTIEQDSLMKSSSKPKFAIGFERNPNFIATTQNISSDDNDPSSLLQTNEQQEEKSYNERLTWAFAKVYINSVLDIAYPQGYDP